MTIGERIKARRIELNLSQEELARKLGYKSRSSINKIELSRDLPLNKITEMARVLDVTEGYLCGWTEEEQPTFIPVPLSAEERELIIEYRNADEVAKQAIKRLVAYTKGINDGQV